MSNPIYLDYHSTTPVDRAAPLRDRRVAEKVYDYMVHNFGNRTQEAVKKAKRQIADLINSSPQEIIFTSGATESINLVIQGLQPSRIIVSPVEHKAVIDTCQAMVKKGLAEIIWLKVDKKARIDLNYLEITSSAYLHSLMETKTLNNPLTF